MRQAQRRSGANRWQLIGEPVNLCIDFFIFTGRPETPFLDRGDGDFAFAAVTPIYFATER
jgi:hypothetical protein